MDTSSFRTAALTKDGKVFTWGSNGDCEIGHGDNTRRKIPTEVESLDGLFIVKITCGTRHIVVISDKGDGT